MSDHDHAHAHSSHGHSHDYASANREFFDKEAHNTDDRPSHVAITKTIISAMREEYPDLFNEDTTTVLDYACGTGVFSRELCQYIKSVVGVDISSGSVDVYNTRASNQGLTPEEMKAICAELKGNAQELDGAKFDIAVCSMSYHHFADVDAITRTLAFFLKPGGSLLVADVMADEKHQDEEKPPEIFPEHVRHVVAHHGGFDEAEMRRIFEGAGLGQFQFKKGVPGKMHSKNVRLFVARGVKPA
ncbi:S-adenosyl-L-methionine-dependent methyltransferase [Obba rivulosa]|uniref:S-adenosyl-L-methionine-dependent methyltransferase n=1 Tax=Obba rivulosa TaxID=1052685 RepID=A0A8E2AKJ8_9APHY|nr:S-adenosyl-L-methionine-dependent methyltransferase [Obba rivulosa]